MRSLALLRHAKSSWKDDLPDHDRPLSARGRRDAPVAGGLLRERDVRPDVVLCSTSVRTRQTWEGVREAGVEAGEVHFERSIYRGGSADLLELLRGVPAGAGTVLLIGHAPGVPDLAEQLAEAADSRAAERVRAKYPTSGLALFAVAQPWAELDRAELRDFLVPRR